MCKIRDVSGLYGISVKSFLETLLALAVLERKYTRGAPQLYTTACVAGVYLLSF